MAAKDFQKDFNMCFHQLTLYTEYLTNSVIDLNKASDQIVVLTKINTFARAIINQTETMGAVLPYFANTPSAETQTPEDPIKQTEPDLFLGHIEDMVQEQNN